MRLFLSCESQTPASNIIGNLMREFYRELDFVTNRERNLEKSDNYGTEFEDIGIIVTCISKEWLANMDNYKERKLIKRKAKEADIRLHMDFEKFMSVDHETQRMIYLDTIIKSIQVVQERSKGDFKGDALVDDILKALDVSKEQLDNLSLYI
jgi:hypothetical protein